MTAAQIDLTPLAREGNELDDTAVVAARAFHNDPFFEYLEPRAVRRSRALALFFRAAVARAGPGAVATGARGPDGRLLGVSVWVPPGHYPPPAADQARQLLGGMRSMALRPQSVWDGLRYLLAMESAHPKGEQLWYLLLLVVDPSVQRSGIGARLQAEGIASADREGLACYLETQNPDNIPYYGRFGYELEKELRPVPGGPPLFTMRRPAR